MPNPSRRPQGLARTQSLHLLGHEGLGRVAITHAALPTIFAVYYRVDSSSITFRAVDAHLASAAHHGDVACFQADASSPDGTPMWSVQVIGRMREAPTPQRPDHNFDWCAGIPVHLSTEIVAGHAFT
ncbi:MAG: pyridoxamine 5'-phosphate oxidase family protein [Ilumatobacteraceae bacterium]